MTEFKAKAERYRRRLQTLERDVEALLAIVAEVDGLDHDERALVARLQRQLDQRRAAARETGAAS